MNVRRRDDEDLPDDTISSLHHCLRAPRRRVVISILWTELGDPVQSRDDEASGSIPVRKLAKDVQATTQGVSLEYATGDMYRNIYTSLCEYHLPLLDQVDAIQYDSDRQVVHIGPNLVVLVVLAEVTNPLIRTLISREQK